MGQPSVAELIKDPIQIVVVLVEPPTCVVLRRVNGAQLDKFCEDLTRWTHVPSGTVCGRQQGQCVAVLGASVQTALRRVDGLVISCG
jgi:hypothetical protein